MKILLGFFDFLIPVLFGYIHVLITERVNTIDYLILFLVYSLGLIIISYLFGFYKEYFLGHTLVKNLEYRL